MNKPVLSLDVSKNSSFAATFLSMEKPFGKPFAVKHTPEGLSLILRQLDALESVAGVKPHVVLESTGIYSKSITHNLQEKGYDVIVLNPIETHLRKRSSIRKVKTDPIDASRIAEVFYLKNRIPTKMEKPIFAELRTLCRHYDGVNELFVNTQLKLHRVLDLIFPYYHDVFPNLCAESSLRILATFPTTDHILSAKKDVVINVLKSAYPKNDWAEEKYQKLLAAAKACLPYKVAQQSNTRVLIEYVRILLTQKRLLTDIRAQIAATAKEIPQISLLTTIPGIGETTAAIIISEIQEIHRFSNDHQLIAFAGLDASVFQSGRFKATKNKISKRGSGYLRKALFQAVCCGVKSHKKKGPVNPLLYQFYQQKVSEGKPKKVALIATCNKLLRIIFGMWRKNEPFNA